MRECPRNIPRGGNLRELPLLSEGSPHPVGDPVLPRGAGSTFPKQPGNLRLLPSSWPRTGPSECRSASWCPSSRRPPWASRCSASVPSASTGETRQPRLPCPACPRPFAATQGRTTSSFPGQCQDGDRLLSTGAEIQQELSGDRAGILLGKAEGRIVVWVGWWEGWQGWPRTAPIPSIHRAPASRSTPEGPEVEEEGVRGRTFGDSANLHLLLPSLAALPLSHSHPRAGTGQWRPGAGSRASGSPCGRPWRCC